MSTTFDITGRTAVVLGGSGALGSAIARAFAEAGAHLVVTGSTADTTARAVRSISGEAREVRGVPLNTLDRAAVRELADDLGPIDILVNCVGGNREGATTAPDRAFFDLELTDLRDVMALNLMAGAILPCQEFGRQMVNNPRGGSIINISSMAAARPLTRVVGYSAAKAAVENFTRWLAVHFAQEYSALLRVNAVAPGFVLTEQNRYLLQTESGGPTARSDQIIAHTPMGRFGQPEDVVGAVLWLASDAARFVTGTVIPIDGGFSAYSGV